VEQQQHRKRVVAQTGFRLQEQHHLLRQVLTLVVVVVVERSIPE
jgi:hypothetical protein